MLLDDDRDKQMRRDQFKVMLVVMLLFTGWMVFLGPRMQPAPPPVPAGQAGQAAPAQPEQTPVDPVAPVAAGAAGLALPPAADAGGDAAGEVVLEDAALRLTFTRVGARLKRAEVLLGEGNRDSIQLVPEAPSGTPDAEAVYPFGLRFAGGYLGDALDSRRWEQTPVADPRAASFSIELPGEVRVTKTFRMGDAQHVLEVEVGVTNLRAQAQVFGLENVEPAFALVWGPNVESGDKALGVHQQILWNRGGENESLPTSELAMPAGPDRYARRVAGAAWTAIKSAYFVVAIKPDFEGAESWASGTPERFAVGVGVPRTEVAPGATLTGAYRAYVGPAQLSSLKQGWDGLEAALQFFTMRGFLWMDSFAKMLLSILHWFHAHIYSNYGVAIVFLTLLVRLVMFPLTYKSMKSMKKMQKLAPELEKIKAEVGDDQQEMQKRMMALYSEHGVNPLSGCFPIFLQMPVFIALYRMLWSAFELRGAPFLWIDDLSNPDRLLMLPFQIPVPFVGAPVDAINLLPFLMGLAMLASVKLMPASPTAVQRPEQKIMMNVMPVMFSVFCYNVSAGLNLYILVSTLLGIAQNYVVHISDAEMAEKPKRRWGSRPAHFYDAAQARKREMHKEMRREKRQKGSRAEGRAATPEKAAGNKKKP